MSRKLLAANPRASHESPRRQPDRKLETAPHSAARLPTTPNCNAACARKCLVNDSLSASPALTFSSICE